MQKDHLIQIQRVFFFCNFSLEGSGQTAISEVPRQDPTKERVLMVRHCTIQRGSLVDSWKTASWRKIGTENSEGWPPHMSPSSQRIEDFYFRWSNQNSSFFKGRWLFNISFRDIEARFYEENTSLQQFGVTVWKPQEEHSRTSWWFFTNPCEKYANRQIGSLISPNISGVNKNMWIATS